MSVGPIDQYYRQADHAIVLVMSKTIEIATEINHLSFGKAQIKLLPLLDAILKKMIGKLVDGHSYVLI